ncbi:single-stranded DNA binding protein [uncultured Caudovirales phage]|uniref:Single-stranded DNA-binding protein n=1 Tax=uncultured Caudovirales phage TaxID=2100421 RepID=A0A6J5L095_9CAUD|nr:single-stranded DNA binding protein [uncultured Caudovirales phage]
MDINALRKMRNNDFGKITDAFDKTANPSSDKKSYVDDRVWKLEPDKAGNASATIRFLPRVEGDQLPWVKIFSHAFQGPTGKWYIENSLSTPGVDNTPIGDKDPVGELNSSLWNNGTEAGKEVARKQKRKLTYVCNVLIISDPKHPENEGQVRLFKFGKKIFDKIMDKARPTFEDEKPVNVFDFWEGADFKLKQTKVEGYPNYDKSTFSEPSPIAESDEEILEIANKQHKLSELLDAKNFKSYADLKKKLDSVLSSTGGMSTAEADAADDAPSYAAPTPKSKPAPTPKASKAPSMEDDDDSLSYFQNMANEA